MHYLTHSILGYNKFDTDVWIVYVDGSLSDDGVCEIDTEISRLMNYVEK